MCKYCHLTAVTIVKMAQGVTVKVEKLDASEIEQKIVELCTANPTGITDKIVQMHIPNVEPTVRVAAFNSLLAQGKLEILKQKNQQLLYRLKNSDADNKCKGSDREEKVVYKIVEEAGDKGIWIRDIRIKSGLVLTSLNKILKSLESKKLIKAVKSVSASKKKVYMLYNLEPDRSVTGGAWYSEQEFESEFVEVLNQQCHRFLVKKLAVAKETTSDPLLEKNASFASSKEVWEFIKKLGISKVQLSVEDIEMILNTLIYDGKVERTVICGSSSLGGSSKDSSPGEDLVNLYRAVEPLIDSAGLMRMPCGTCPVIHNCYEGGAVSPATCQYFKKWLSEDFDDNGTFEDVF
ncbi:DNA-directed RNA polymerase III subunit RPC6 [Dermacentor andersoni]|uniref:DNA-directed RNA polymerase III subunit RPC6 n=1 Tax=Dermacentor andersoni TaxID=34620 RepID=UPI00241686E9|nr:DNA-directed RNA polymerase III subunit RPC6-like [Dermacentor andersoni]